MEKRWAGQARTHHLGVQARQMAGLGTMLGSLSTLKVSSPSLASMDRDSISQPPIDSPQVFEQAHQGDLASQLFSKNGSQASPGLLVEGPNPGQGRAGQLRITSVEPGV